MPLDELLQRTDKFGHKMFVRGLVENLRDLQRREVRLAKRRARGEVVDDEVEEEKNPIEDKKAAALALKAKKQAEREAQREMEELMRQREDVIDEEGEALMDLMDAEEGHGPMPVARPPPVPRTIWTRRWRRSTRPRRRRRPSRHRPAHGHGARGGRAGRRGALPRRPPLPWTRTRRRRRRASAPTQLVPPTQDVADGARRRSPCRRPGRATSWKFGARVQLAAVPRN